LCFIYSLWILDKCAQYIEGVIYNLELSLEEDNQQPEEKLSVKLKSASNSEIDSVKTEYLSFSIKKQTFLVHSYL